MDAAPERLERLAFSAARWMIRAMSPLELYTTRAAERRNEVARLAARERRISLARVVAVVAAFAMLFWIPLLAIVPAIGFVILLVVHERAIQARKRAERGALWFESGLLRLRGEWSGHGVAGDEFLAPHHLYASDLDLFGRGSIYELLCTARTTAGRAMLASWLNATSRSPEEITQRQAAVAELRDAAELREELASTGEDVAKDLDVAKLRAWSAAPARLASVLDSRLSLLLGSLGMLTFLVTLPALFAKLAGYTHPESAAKLGAIANLPTWPLLVMIAIEVVFARRLHARVSEVIHGVELAEEPLAVLARVVGVVERASFTTARLVALQERLRATGASASQEVERLRRLVALLDSRRNQFFAPFAALMLWTTNIAFALERWRGGAGRSIGAWVDTVAEVEALASFGTFAFEQQDFVCFPEVGEGTPAFAAEGLGHPLISAEKRVVNDVAFGDGLQLLLVSGSNMSGKSTMMRSIGVATVLALAGAPVVARRLRITPVTVGASIRIGDSLQEGASKFYAEILRIRDILALSRTEPLLFLLDEVLAGTNSHDRRIGAEAIVRALVEHGSIGLVSTHDLALARVVDSLGAKARNVHFEDHIEEGRVVFDYRMRDGVVEKSNAVELMRSVGIEI